MKARGTAEAFLEQNAAAFSTFLRPAQSSRFSLALSLRLSFSLSPSFLSPFLFLRFLFALFLPATMQLLKSQRDSFQGTECAHVFLLSADLSFFPPAPFVSTLPSTLKPRLPPSRSVRKNDLTVVKCSR